MTMIKRGHCSSSVIISEQVYSCPQCGHTMIKTAEDEDSIKCPHCDNSAMEIISSTTSSDTSVNGQITDIKESSDQEKE